MSTSRQFNTPISLSSAALTATHNSNTIGNIFTTGGNVGINTTIPGSALHVAGSIPYIPLGDGVHIGIDPTNSSAIQLNAGGSTTGTTVIDFGYSGVTYESRIVHTNSTNMLGFRVNGNLYDSLSISSTGNVGIGTTTPSSNLTISTNGAGPQVAMYPQSNGGETSMSFYNNNIASGNTTRWVVGHNVTVGIGNFGFWNSSFNAPVMALTSTGNIGIGTTNPTSTLDIVNSSPLVTLRDSSGSNGKIYFGNSSHGVGRNASIGTLTYANDVALWTDGAGASIGFATLLTERMRITGAGNVGINTTAPSHNLEILGDLGINKGIRLLRSGTLNYIQSGTSTGSASSADLRFTDIFANSTYMTIRTSGNVGIGTTTPTYTLDVNGTLEASNSNGLMLFASSGNVLIGSTTPTGSAFGNGNLYMYGANGSNNGIAINGVGNSTLQFWNSGTMKGAVVSVATAGNWSTDSRVGDMVIRCASSQSMLFNSNGGSGVATMVISGGNVGIGTTAPTTAKLVISGSNGAIGLDLSSTDQYAEMRVIRNSLSSLDKDMYIQLGAGSGSKLKLYSNNTETMVLNSGNVGIGMTPSVQLHLAASGTYSYIRGEGGGGLVLDATSNAVYLATAGVLRYYANAGGFSPQNDNICSLGANGTRWTAVYAANGTIQTSDSSLKNAEPLQYGLNEVMQMNTIKFKWKSQTSLPDDDPTKNYEYYGFCADELASVFPELVYDEHENTPVQMNYTEIIPVLVNAIKELKHKNDKLHNFLQLKFPDEFII